MVSVVLSVFVFEGQSSVMSELQMDVPFGIAFVLSDSIKDFVWFICCLLFPQGNRCFLMSGHGLSCSLRVTICNLLDPSQIYVSPDHNTGLLM